MDCRYSPDIELTGSGRPGDVAVAEVDERWFQNLIFSTKYHRWKETHLEVSLGQSLLDVRHARQSVLVLNVTSRYPSLPPIILVLSVYAPFQLAIHPAPMFKSFKFQTNPEMDLSRKIIGFTIVQLRLRRILIGHAKTQGSTPTDLNKCLNAIK